MEDNKIYTSRGILYFDEFKILHVQLTPNLEIDLDSIQKSYQVLKELSHHEKLYVLVDFRQAKTMDKSARDFAAGAEMTSVLAAVALLIKNPIGIIISSLIMSYNKPPFPAKEFFTEPDAIRWLQQQIRNNETSCPFSKYT